MGGECPPRSRKVAIDPESGVTVALDDVDTDALSCCEADAAKCEVEPGAEASRVMGEGGVTVTLEEVERPRLLPGTRDDRKPGVDGVDEPEDEEDLAPGEVVFSAGEGVECNDGVGE